ncbi:gamma-glutamyltransferase family protein [Acidiferrobacter sp. SPIII_3]|uniref:gamma-glutamyltransferase family protein n=1 Tax=Acidiferrobacter sp. SPIII_3 TaxID=1281578 RepID=UPI00143E093B|nr:gamma-glutamyltransferase [Acidiferrobacter sp. SPIII_3]
MSEGGGARAVAVAPHAAAAQAAARVLKDGGGAIEAMVAAAAVIAVVYPHMTGLGGDGFWLIHEPGREPYGIDAGGTVGALATPDLYRARGHETMPARGALAANTVAGTVAGWELALAQRQGPALALERLLEDAIEYAEHGFRVSASQATSTRGRLAELRGQPGFGAHFLAPDGSVLAHGTTLCQPALAATLRGLAQHGLRDFYEGAVGDRIAADLAAVASPVTCADLRTFRARVVTPLRMAHSLGTLYNLPPPTQGVLSLMILGILDRLGLDRCPREGADMIHLALEATKRAFRVRDRHKGRFLEAGADVGEWLVPSRLDAETSVIDPAHAAPWRAVEGPADTVWLGVVDRRGCAVSFIQSLYHEFGSGVVLPGTGICWQNRGTSLSLTGAADRIAPGRRPFHTLNPALARLADGRLLAYGAMGGDGQPQTQAAVFTRAAVYGDDARQAVAAPRWLLGRTWGSASDDVKIETRFPDAVFDELERRGHVVSRLAPFDEIVGHAGLVMRDAGGMVSGGADPRSDGAVVFVD